MSPEFFNRLKDFSYYFRSLIDNNNETSDSHLLKSKIKNAISLNRWFTDDNIILRLSVICDFISSEEFKNFCLKTKKRDNPVKIGVISEENIPLEEFPVLIAILFSGNSFIYKTSAKSDQILIFFFEQFIKHFPEFIDRATFSVSPLKNTDSIILTSKENSNSTINQYLKKKKSLLEIRHHSVAVINEDESPETLAKLGDDLFTWFGLGCINVKKIFIPRYFDIKRIFEAIEPWNKLMHHNAYMNNYQYSQSVYLLNKTPHLDNGFVLLKEDASLTAPTAVINYEFYHDKKQLISNLNKTEDVYLIYCSNPSSIKEKNIGSSVKQLLLPSESILKFLYD
jgi:hypothetical protein